MDGAGDSNPAACEPRIDDFAQIACAELAHALPGFRFSSRLSTWARQVIVQSVQRAIRDRQALKRGKPPDALESPGARTVQIPEAEHPESIAEARVLIAQINSLLATQPDTRLAQIFHLYVIADMRFEDVGKRVQLSASQVRILLKRTIEMLQNDPSMQLWIRDHEEEVMERHSRQREGYPNQHS